tara:strand:- start:243 stop:1037 length:795 start_codon:yes stop_codon:yes gene_type:complete
MKTFYYDSINAFVSRASQPLPEGYKGLTDSREEGTRAFTGTDNFEEARKLATEGWSAGRKRLLESQKEISFAGSCKSLDPAPFFDVAGDECDVARFLEGEPENMLEYQFDYTDKQANKVQKITLDICASGGVPSDVFPRVGACMLMIADALEGAGYRVEIEFVQTSSGSKFDGQWKTLLKPADQPLDLNSLAFWSMHPSALRRFWFALYERDVPANKQSSGYGSARRMKAESDDEIVICVQDDHFYDDLSTLNHCNEVLARFND